MLDTFLLASLLHLRRFLCRYYSVRLEQRTRSIYHMCAKTFVWFRLKVLKWSSRSTDSSARSSSSNLPIEARFDSEVRKCVSELFEVTAIRPPSMTEVVELYVVMHCEACAASVRRAIRKIPGVESYKIDSYSQKVTVIGKVNREDVLRRIRKTGKRATLIPKPAPPKKEERKESEKEERKESEKEEKKESQQEEKKESQKEEKPEKKEEKKSENKAEDIPDSPVVVRKKSMYWPAVRLWKFFIPREVKIHEKKEEVAIVEEKKEESKKEESKEEEQLEGKEEGGSGKKDSESKQKEAEWVPMFVSAPFYTLPSQILVT